MLKNPKAKGSRRERQVRDILISRGYSVIKAGGSLGCFDLIAIANEDILIAPDIPYVLAIQVKSNYMPPQEVYEIVVHPICADKEIWIKVDRKPWIKCRID